jgi:predicted nuclease with TOPRIM domain
MDMTNFESRNQYKRDSGKSCETIEENGRFNDEYVEYLETRVISLNRRVEELEKENKELYEENKQNRTWNKFFTKLPEGFLISVHKNKTIERGSGKLLIHPDDIPKNT